MAAETGGITVTDAWSRAPTGPALPGVAYLTITDTGAADRLTAISTPAAAHAMLHQSRMTNGVLEGVTQRLEPGDSLPITLTFEHAGPVTATVTVRPVGAAQPSGRDKGGTDMEHRH